MNTYLYKLGAFTLAFVIGGTPIIALANESTSTLEVSRTNVQMQNSTQFENSNGSVRSFGELKAKIELREKELDQDEASTTSEEQDIVRNTNPVRLAVHAFLNSRDILGGIGEQVSEIAKEMNDSNATTTRMEIKMHSRGFLTRLFFGGDRNSAEIISRIVIRNQELIEDLTALLDQANISADVRVTLNAQITALENAQTRLMNLATKERSNWGIFSWRF
ncbi:MAG: hypothetical protein Q8P17_01935 [bacterium]|nr:hypothetical protein [bacterium]